MIVVNKGNGMVRLAKPNYSVKLLANCRSRILGTAIWLVYYTIRLHILVNMLDVW